jgi:beta-lactam-binding protein with PASTA domain
MLDALVGATLVGAPLIALPAAAPAQGGRVMMAQPSTVTVPPVKGLRADSADSVLKHAGLRSVHVSRRVIGGISGNVLDQSPAAGRPAKRGDFDTIFVAVAIPVGAVSGIDLGAKAAAGATGGGGQTNVPRVAVPRVIGLLPKEADSSLRAHRLVLRGVESRPSDAAYNGRVIDQSIRPDTSVFVGTPIGVVIGSYTPPPPPQLVPLPDLTKRTIAAARELVAKAGLVLRVTSMTASLNPANRDTIVRTQNPPYPGRVAPKSLVTVTVITYSQALSDSVARARQESVIVAQRDSADRARRDSVDRARRDSIDRAHRDSVKRARDDSIAKARQDSARRVADSLARVANVTGTTGRGSRGAGSGRGPAPPPRMVTVPVLAFMTLHDARVRAGDSLSVVADADAAENSTVKSQNPGPLARVPFGSSVRLVVEPAGPTYWTWILIAAGVVALGGLTLLVKRFWPEPVVPTPPTPPKPPTPSQSPPPTPAITTGVSGDAPRVRLHSDNRDLRGPEVELHAVETVMACDVVVAGPSLTLEDDYNAKR